MAGPDSSAQRASGAESQGESASSATRLDAAFESIIKSDTFSKAYAIRSLLRYLWAHRNDDLDEYLIAVHGLNRKPDFDPKTDSAVRVSMARLRGKLREYYEGEGRDSPLLLWIPRNGYDLEYHLSDRRESVGDTPTVAAPAARFWTVRNVVIASLVALACLLVGWWIGLRSASQSTAAAGRAVELPPFWQRFSSGSNRVLFVLPDTLFLQWRDGQLMVGDSSVGAFSTWKSSALLLDFAQRFGNPAASGNYLSVQDALATVRLTQYLSRLGMEVRVIAAKDLMVDSFLDTNVVLIGLPDTSFQLQSRTARLNFKVEAGGAVIRNLRPTEGEPQTFDTVAQTGHRQMSHGLVGLLPGRTPSLRILVLSATNPLFLLPVVTSKGPLDEVERSWRRASSPGYFQSVVESVTEGDAVLRIRIVAFRPVPPPQ